jgi:selenide,water dikinase
MQADTACSVSAQLGCFGRNRLRCPLLSLEQRPAVGCEGLRRKWRRRRRSGIVTAMRPVVPFAQDLVLVGGGHAHVHVLKRFGMRPIPGVRLTLVARDLATPYSGMLPGHVAGLYRFAECHIDLVRLARFAGARLIHDEATGLDRARREVLCRGHPPIRYDLVSLDIGSTPRLDAVPGAAAHTTAVKPIADFARRWEALLRRAQQEGGVRLAVVGGGAGGVELALAAQHRLAGLFVRPPEVTLVTRDGLLPSHNVRVRRRFARLFAKRGMRVVSNNPVVRVEPGRLIAADGRAIDFDEALWVTEAAGAPWLAETGLPLDDRGFLLVDETLRSPADPAVFAAGDVATMSAHPREKSGVYAVRAGPPLADNLRRALAGRRLRRFVPQRRALALIGSGDGRAAASRGPFAAYGASLWRLKDWIDRRWMRRYTELPEMAAEADVESGDAMRCGGCAAKVPADVLARAVARLGAASSEAVTIGLAAPDDAALISFPGAPPLLQTVDFFRAMVSDPYLFGRIAANHALGDIYAMGGLPETAMAIASLPPARPALVEADLFHLLKGGSEVLEAAGAVLVGGHSAEGAEVALGFAVTGRPRPGHLLRKAGLKPGDRVLLTKPLGTGVILAAEMRGKAAAGIYEGAVAAMLQSARAASACLVAHRARACTDVTGFGLLGHLREMLAASGVDARLDPDAIPALDGALQLFAAGIASSLHAANTAELAVLAPDGMAPDAALTGILLDPQTAGGLLTGVPAAQAAPCLDELRRLGYRAAAIGVVVPRAGERACVALAPGCLREAHAPVPASAAG